jgi:hypothetical protein
MREKGRAVRVPASWLFVLALPACAGPGAVRPAAAQPDAAAVGAAADTAAAHAGWEPGLEARRQRFRRPAWQQAAMVPVHLLRLPFSIVNYPVEHWLVHKEPGALTVYARRVYTRIGVQGFALRVGGLGSGSGVGAGVRYEPPRRWTGGKPLQLAAGITHRGYDRAAASLDSLRWGPLTSGLRLQYDDRPEEDFFGVGLTSRRLDRSTYEQREVLGGLHSLVDLGGAWRLSLQVAASQSDIDRGRDEQFPAAQDRFDPRRVVGLDGRFRFLDYGVGVVYDSRDVPRYARRGSYLQLGVQATDGLGDTPHAFTKYVFEVQHAVPLPGHRRGLAGRLRAVVTDNRAQEDIPVFRLEPLGGSRSIRGYSTYRFLDKDLLLGNLEYRFPVWSIEPPNGQALDGVVFLDFGTVMSNLEDTQQRDLRSGAGVGVRMVTAHDLLFRADNAWTSEGYRFHLGLRGTF